MYEPQLLDRLTVGEGGGDTGRRGKRPEGEPSMDEQRDGDKTADVKMGGRSRAWARAT